MSQSNNGEIYLYSQNVYDRDIQLQNNEVSKLHLPQAEVPYAAEQYRKILSMDMDELNKLTIEECVKYEFLLSSYSLFIKRVANTEKSRMIYLKHKINSIICAITVEGYASAEIKRYSAIQSNEAAKKYNEDLVVAEQKYARLEDLHFGINNIADKIKNIQFLKQRELSDG